MGDLAGGAGQDRGRQGLDVNPGQNQEPAVVDDQCKLRAG